MLIIIQTTFLSALFLTAVGILLALYGIFLHASIEIQGADGLTVDSSSLQFCGAALRVVQGCRGDSTVFLECQSYCIRISTLPMALNQCNEYIGTMH